MKESVLHRGTTVLLLFLHYLGWTLIKKVTLMSIYLETLLIQLTLNPTSIMGISFSIPCPEALKHRLSAVAPCEYGRCSVSTPVLRGCQPKMGGEKKC